jgi:hypothetical protein
MSQLVGGIDPRDSRVVFDEGEHKYYVDGQPMEISVTGLVHEYFPAYQPEVEARRMLTSNFFGTPRYSQYWPLMQGLQLHLPEHLEVAIERLTESWRLNGDQASGDGTVMHQAIEDFYCKGQLLPTTKECQLFQGFHAYITAAGYLPFRSEQIVWDTDLRLAGSADMLYIHSADLPAFQAGVRPIPLILVDWKRSKQIRTQGFAKRGQPPPMGFGPLADRQDCNFEHYSLQLNIYKNLMQKHYQMQIYEMYLVILHPNQDGPEILPVADNQRAVEVIFADRQK